MVTKTKTKLGNQRPTQSVNLHFAKSLAHEAINYYKKNRAKLLSMARKYAYTNYGRR